MKHLYVILIGILCLSSCQEEEIGACREYSPETRKEILWTTKVVDGSVQTKAVGERGKYWKMGDTIRIKFLNGDADLQQKVIKNAAIWLQYAGLEFKYVSMEEEADVKIGFDMDERWLAWSTIGTDCKLVPQNEASLNFVWLADEDEEGVRAEVLRGFGHVLGMGFEHRNPGAPVRFKPTADIMGEYNLSEQEVEEFKTLYTAGSTDYTDYDKSSIMVVTIPRSFVVSPNQATTRNSNLSDKDKEFISDIYPPLIMTLKVYGDMVDVTLCASEWAAVPGPHKRIVDWGDGSIEKLEKDVLYFHVYKSVGEYTIHFYGVDSLYGLFYTRKGATSIDVSRAKKLKTLYCDDGTLTEIDLSNNRELLLLSVMGNKLKTLDLSHNPLLSQLTCRGNEITELDLSTNDSLMHLWCENNKLTSLDLSHNKGLLRVFSTNNQIETLTLGDMPLLGQAMFDNNRIESIIMGYCPGLWRLECRRNRLTGLNFTNMPEISRLLISGNNFVNIKEVLKDLPDRSSKAQGTIEVDVNQKELIEGFCYQKGWYVTVPNVTTRSRSVSPDRERLRPEPGVDSSYVY